MSCELRVAVLVVAGAVAAAGCGSSPTGPSPQPTPTPPPVVTPPTITGLTVSASRAEVGDTVTATATVTDAEKDPNTLTYVWSATVGTFTGTGATVTWSAPKGTTPTPADVVITLAVVEPYQTLVGSQLVNQEHRVTQTASPIRLHDSVAEISKMARTFLIDYFGNINVSPDACLVDFTTNRALCPTGRDAEYQDIVDNRAEYADIYDAQVRIDSVTLNGDRSRAGILAPCLFRSRQTNGELEAYAGTCELSAVYDNGRWWLCESYFRNPVPIPTSGAYPLGRTMAGAPVEPGTFPFYFR